MTNADIKRRIIDRLYDREYYIRQVNPVEYQTRCPFCGDSDNIHTGHLYIRINPEDNFPIVYNCFKCSSFGFLTPDLLHLLEIDDAELKGSVSQLNRSSDKFDSKNLFMEERFKMFDYQIPRATRGKKIQYIENRLGVTFTDSDLEEMKLITSLKDFLILNKIHELPFDNYICNIIERDYVGFLSFGNSHILFRDTTEKNKYAWIKYPITKESMNNRLFYSMRLDVNMITDEPVILNLTEGVMDILSARYNLGYHGENVINIAVGGIYFNRILLFLLDLGLVGSNVTVNIFADNDKEFNPNAKVKTTVEYFKKSLGNMKYLYGSIYIYHNQVYKDIGTTKDKIILKKTKL